MNGQLQVHYIGEPDLEMKLEQMLGKDVLTIEAGRTERHYWADLWRYRELFYFLAWRDILVRYKQTVLGIAWAVLRPFLTMIIFTLIFSKLAKLPSDNAPYPILVFAALLPWQLFASGFTEAGNSLTSNANMISKVYFPRLIIPASAIIVSLVDFLISSVLLVALMAWYRVLARLANYDPAAFCHDGGVYGNGGWPVDCSAKRKVPRLPLYRAFWCATGTLRFPCRIQQLGHP